MKNNEKIIMKKVYGFWEKFGFFFIPFITFLSAIIFFEFLYSKYFSITLFTTKYLYAIIYAIFLAGVVSMFNTEKKRNIVTITLLFLITALYVIEGVHFRAFRSIALLSAIARLGDLAGATDSIWEFVSHDLVFFAFPLLVYIFYSLVRKGKKNGIKQKNTLVKGISIFAVAIVILVIANFKMVTINGDVNKEKFRNSTMYLKKYGLLDTITKEVSMKVTKKGEKQAELEIPSIEENFKYIPEENAMTNIYKGKNLVFIEAESIAPYAIDKQLTPTLYKIQQEGYNFTEYHSARINTFESEYAILNSFYLTPEKERDELTSAGTMPTLFRNENYTSQSFHNYLSSMYSRPLRHVELGFENFYGAKDLGIVVEPGTNFPSDVELFENSFEKFATKDNPFFAYEITVSGHAAYDAEKRPALAENIEKVKALYPDYPQEVQVYMAAAMQTDQGVEVLMEKLKAEGLYDDTVVIFVGDHYPYALRENIEKAFGITNSLAQYKVPFIIWDSSKPATDVTSLSTNVDILPTISNMFDLDLQYTMGQDLFSTNKDKVIVDWHDVRSYSFLTTDIGYDGDLYLIYGDFDEVELQKAQEVSYQREEWNNSEYVREKMKR